MKRTTLLSLLASALILALLPATFTASVEAREPLVSQQPVRAPAPPAPWTPAATETTYTYDDVPATPLTIDDKTSCDGREIVRTFNVADSFTVVDARLGFNATHTFRGDLRVTLESPTGIRVELINATNGDGWGNFDLLLSDASANPINDLDNDDPLEPFYDRTARPRNPLNAFSGQASTGAWTLTICDAEPTGDDGAYNRAQLQLDPPPAGVALRASLAAEPLKTARGLAITYQAIIRNVGLTDATNTTLTDAIPAGASSVAGSLNTQGSPPAAFDGAQVSWTGTVPAGQSVAVTYRVAVSSAPGALTNTATVTHASLPTPLQPAVASQVFAVQDRLRTNETDYPIPDNGCPAHAATAPIVVAGSFTVAAVRVGLSLDHTYRGDLSATLRSPADTRVDLIAADPDDYRENYDILLDDASVNPLNDSSNDNLTYPFYDRTVAPAKSLAAFAGQDAAGTWTLIVCDADPIDDGVLRQWSLFFDTPTPPAAPVVFISTGGATGADVRLDWNAVEGGNWYRVWYAGAPYFEPNGTPVQAGTALSYPQSGAAADAGQSTFYVVSAAADAESAESDISNRTGKFSFQLVAGSGP